MSEGPKFTKVNGLRKADGNPVRLGFNSRNTIYMRKLYDLENPIDQSDIYDYSKTCCKGQLPCLKGCTSDTKDINTCLSIIRKRYELTKQNPNIDPKDLGITNKYYDYYMEQFKKLDKNEEK